MRHLTCVPSLSAQFCMLQKVETLNTRDTHCQTERVHPGVQIDKGLLKGPNHVLAGYHLSFFFDCLYPMDMCGDRRSLSLRNLYRHLPPPPAPAVLSTHLLRTPFQSCLAYLIHTSLHTAP